MNKDLSKRISSKLLLYPEKYLGSLAGVLGESQWINLHHGDGNGILVV